MREAGVVTSTLCNRLKSMVGFRNVAAHDYRKLNLAVIRNILETHLNDFNELANPFCKRKLK